MSKSHWSLCVPFSRTNPRLCIYHLFVWSNLKFLHITLPTQSCLVLYSFCANLVHWIIIIIIIIIIIHSLRIFHNIISKWSFTGVTASFLKSPRLFWRTSKCCSLSGLCSSFNFQPFQPPYTPLGIILSVQITTDATVTLMFLSFFSSLENSQYLSFFLLSLIFSLWSTWTPNYTTQQVTLREFSTSVNQCSSSGVFLRACPGPLVCNLDSWSL